MFKTKLNGNFDFLKTCRLCLNQTNEIISIFDISNFEILYSVIINECTDVMISENDKLPKNICLECVECLNKFYQFRKLVVNSEISLNDYFNKCLNNSTKDVKVENAIYIKEENLDVYLNEEPNSPTCSIKSEEDQHSLVQALKIENTNNIKVENLNTDSNEERTCLVKKEKEEHGMEEDSEGFEYKIEIVEEKLITGKNEKLTTATTKSLTQDKHNFTSSSHLSQHESVHTGLKFSACTECENGLLHTRKCAKRYTCNECNKIYVSESLLKEHERVHTEKLFICKQCDKAFGSKSHLKYHERIHTGEKPYSCDQCGKSFTNLSNLKKHQQIHTGEKSHTCDQCGKCFYSSSHLKRHKLVHSDERPYICKYCEKTFCEIRNLKFHERTHTGEKPYNCNVCDKSFTVQCSLKRHMRIHKGEKPYNCKQCGKSFNQLDHVRRHEKTHIDKKSSESVSL